MKTRFIGDVHGKFEPYKSRIRGVERSVQVGDMGVGFYKQTPDGPRAYANPPHDTMKREGNHRYIRGNHDNLTVCKTQDLWIPDGTVEDNVMFVGSATSIDKAWRTEGFDWWADECLSIEELYTMYDKYMMVKPEIMVTHECPESVAVAMLAMVNKVKFNETSPIRQAFDSMFENHKPKLWLFGHWHFDMDFELLGTRFICLNELSYVDVDTKTLEVFKENKS